MSRENQLRALVVYESMFGCTRDIAHAVADGLRLEGATVDLVEVGSATPGDDATFDVLVVGAPTHAFSLSRPATRADAVRQGAPAGVEATGLREWLTTVGRAVTGEGRLAAAFDTRATKVRRLPLAASTRAATILTRHGYELISRPMPFLVEDIKGPLVAGELDRAVTWGRVVALAARQRIQPTPAAAR